MVGEAEAEGEGEEVEPAGGGGRPVLGEEEEVGEEENGRYHMRVGVDGVLPDIGPAGDEEGGEENGRCPDYGIRFTVHASANRPNRTGGKEGGGGGGEGSQQVHPPGDFTEGDKALRQFAEQGEEGVARRMGEAQDMGHHRVLRRVAINGHTRQRQQIKQQNQQGGEE